MKKRVLAVAALSFLISTLAWSQQPAQPPTRPPTPPAEPTRQAAPERRPSDRRLQQTTFLTGKVIMEDGLPLPEPVAVELVCGGQVRKRIYSQTNGDFTVVIGDDRMGSSLDADIAGPSGGNLGRPGDPFADRLGIGGDPGRVDLSNCELRASLSGFTSNRVWLGIRRTLDKPDVGTIVLSRISKADTSTVSFNTLAAPEKARKAYDNAKKLFDKVPPDHAKATNELEKATREYPAYAAAWNLLGRVRLALDDEPGAREALEKSVSADPKLIEPYIHLATIEAKHARWAETVKWIDQIEQLNPAIPHANYLGAFANYQLGRFDQAEKSARVVEKSAEAKRFAMAFYILGAIHAKRGEHEPAATEFRRYIELDPSSKTSATVARILADWEEQGQVKKKQ